MRSSDLLPALARAGRLSAREYLVEYPSGILLGAVLPRALLQVVFLTMLGRAVGGADGALAAGLGASAFNIVSATVIKGPDVLIEDRVQGTLYRLRMTEIPLAALVAARWVVYAAEGLITALLAVPVVALLTGRTDPLTDLPSTLPLYLLMALTASSFGLALAVVAVGRRADVFLTNFGSYLVLAFSGVLAALPTDGPRALAGAVLPISHGIAALRAVQHGADAGLVLRLAATEALVGLGWALAAVLGLRIQAYRLRRSGNDFLN
ncbi:MULTISPECIES: ABC transporter permease [unclassified Kitasatospora]|uniref:ABC transporter permease n=1 Tax=unclassified Kitasatospora TaxID=2633591 RepID=UPI00070CEFC8|nr:MULTISPECIES: ABC transporter permease [unclassified Kitasatospora]KQV17506.1 hypothetical protein ASC99_25365 [Kitasatospora sp. Root107]KRB69247.1 hypothetical protein ASE03_27810 [Kitasatospora sp. Root187]